MIHEAMDASMGMDMHVDMGIGMDMHHFDDGGLSGVLDLDMGFQDEPFIPDSIRIGDFDIKVYPNAPQEYFEYDYIKDQYGVLGNIYGGDVQGVIDVDKGDKMLTLQIYDQEGEEPQISFDRQVRIDKNNAISYISGIQTDHDIQAHLIWGGVDPNWNVQNIEFAVMGSDGVPIGFVDIDDVVDAVQGDYGQDGSVDGSAATPTSYPGQGYGVTEGGSSSNTSGSTIVPLIAMGLTFLALLRGFGGDIYKAIKRPPRFGGGGS